VREIDVRGARAPPNGTSGRRETQLAGTSRQANVTAVFNSAPPMVKSSESVRSSRSFPGGVNRTIASPKVTTGPPLFATLNPPLGALLAIGYWPLAANVFSSMLTRRLATSPPRHANSQQPTANSQ
jgi:hypothetical protein